MTREEQVEALLRAKEVLEELSARIIKGAVGSVADQQQVLAISQATMACVALGGIDIAVKILEDGL